MNYFKLDESPFRSNKFLIRVTEEFYENYDLSSSGSLGILPARLLNLSYANYLRFCRDILGAELIGKNSRYVIVYFDNNPTTRQFLKLLNSRMELVLLDKKNPLEKYKREGLLV